MSPSSLSVGFSRRWLNLSLLALAIGPLAGCQQRRVMMDIHQNLAPGLEPQPWANSREGQAFQRELRVVVKSTFDDTGEPLSVTRQLQTGPDTDMSRISEHYAKALGSGWQRKDTQLDTLNATVWHHQQQALLLAWSHAVHDWGEAGPRRLVLLASTPATPLPR